MGVDGLANLLGDGLGRVAVLVGPVLTLGEGDLVTVLLEHDLQSADAVALVCGARAEVFRWLRRPASPMLRTSLALMASASFSPDGRRARISLGMTMPLPVRS